MSRSVYVWVAISIAVIVAAVAIVAALHGARRANPEGQTQKADYEQPGRETADSKSGLPVKIEVESPSVVQYDEAGNAIWSAAAEGVFTHDADAGRTVGDDVRWELAREENSLSIAAKRMEYDESGLGDASFEGDVVIKALGDREFRAKRARYEAGTEKVICEGGAEFEWLNYSGSVAMLVVDLKAQEMRGSKGGALVRQ